MTTHSGDEFPRERHRRTIAARVAAVGSLVAFVVVLGAIVLGGGGGSHAKKASSSGSGGTSTGGSGSQSGNGKPTLASVPILAYRVINDVPAGSSADPALYVPPDAFSAQMNALKSAGWRAVTLNQLEAYWTHGTALPTGKPIVITFDTGYASQYTNALPVLKQLGWVGVENVQINGLPQSEGGISDAQIRGLIAAGWEIDSGGISAGDLTSLDSSSLQTELTSSKDTLHSRYNVPVNWFAYPGGHYDANVVAAVRAAGYAGASTFNPGWASPQGDRYRLPRIVVQGGTSASQLLSQITSAQENTSTPASF
jgi:peptidoglycan/xylan/chitin deacetylase (PgdA/CDA1 family)